MSVGSYDLLQLTKQVLTTQLQILTGLTFLGEGCEHFIKLLCHAYKRSSLGKFFQFRGTNVSTSWAHSSQYILNCSFHRTSVRDFNRLTFWCSAKQAHNT